MNKLALVALAASAAVVSTSALAQHRSGGHGGGMGGHSGGGMRGHMGGGHGGGMRVHTGGGYRSGGVSWHGGGTTVRHHGGNWNRHGGHFRHPGRNFRHFRMNRGFSINAFWFGPQFHINDWQLYGFANPGDDGRWVRYYDDAYLIDREGRVQDYRYGVDWDRYGERWDDDDGIPSYHGRRDYRPDDEDDRDDDRDDEDDGDYTERGGPAPGPGWDYRHYGHGAPGYPVAPGYGGYGYGYYAYPIVIETTVTTSGGYTEEVVEEVVQTRRAHRPHRVRCDCRRTPVRHRPAPPRRPPPAGERG